MARASQITFRGQAEGHAAAAALLHSAGEVSLDHRGVARALVMRCPDGCGDVLTINLDTRSGKAWRTDVRDGRLTVYPSVWRNEGCRAHFIIWRDRLIWCDRYDPAPWHDEKLINHVRLKLRARPGEFQHFETIADELGEIPWEVWWACQRLHRQGEAEKQGDNHFRARSGAGPTSKRWLVA